ncbi:hypothetical protein ZOSMA_158G00050 [Zostera marina]|uniref:Retrotransposon gag domain-containing protein n=1 Tax=Zostera marina TaxID=29655 RepID=A0A0K9PV62_ZOSMR|nr:hypothetical protein ZOSMA_158G00050 [Zostera marina]
MKTSPPTTTGYHLHPSTSNDTILPNTRHASRLKTDIPVFYGLTNNEAFVDWVADIEDYFAYVPFDDSTTAQLVALRLKGCAKPWWRQTQSNRADRNKRPILTWKKMKSLMYESFLPANYQ